MAGRSLYRIAPCLDTKKDHRGAMVLLFQLVPKATRPARLRALDFESSASANSATSARVWCNEDILALKHHFVNGFPRFGVLQSERKFIGRVNTDWPADGDACQFSVFHGCLDGNGTARFLEDEASDF